MWFRIWFLAGEALFLMLIYNIERHINGQVMRLIFSPFSWGYQPE